MQKIIRNSGFIFISLILLSGCNQLVTDSKDLEIKCVENKFSSCTRVGVRKAFGTRGYKRDYKSALIFLKKGCEGGDAQGCKEMGVMFEHGRGTAKNFKKAAELYETACTGKIANACNNLGDFYRLGRGVPKNPQKSAIYYKKACDSGYKSKCK